jgi:hypothetical protein
MSQARKARRAIAKSLGYLKKDESVLSFRERVRRAHQMGKQFHTIHLQNIMNQEIQAGRILTNQNLENLAIEKNNNEENFGTNLNSFNFLSEFKPEGSPEIEIQDNPK